MSSNQLEPGDSREHFAFELFVAAVERAKLIILLSLLAGIATYAALTQWPKWYTSVASLSLKDQEAQAVEVMMRSNAILDAVLAQHPSVTGDSPEERRRKLNRMFRWTPTGGVARRTATLFNLDVDAKDPVEAQSINTALIDNWLLQSKPKPDTKARTEAQLARNEEQLAAVSMLITRLEKETPTLVTPSSLQGELATSLAGMRQRRDTIVESIAALRLALAGGSRDVIFSPPSLPVEPSWPKKGISAAVAAGLTGLATLVGVLIVAALKMLEQRPGMRGRIDRLRDAARLLPRRASR